MREKKIERKREEGRGSLSDRVKQKKFSVFPRKGSDLANSYLYEKKLITASQFSNLYVKKNM